MTFCQHRYRPDKDKLACDIVTQGLPSTGVHLIFLICKLSSSCRSRFGFSVFGESLLPMMKYRAQRWSDGMKIHHSQLRGEKTKTDIGDRVGPLPVAFHVSHHPPVSCASWLNDVKVEVGDSTSVDQSENKIQRVASHLRLGPVTHGLSPSLLRPRCRACIIAVTSAQSQNKHPQMLPGWRWEYLHSHIMTGHITQSFCGLSH